MPNLGAPEILVILIVALLIFGPRKLPELGKSLGAGLREFRRSTQGLKEEFEGVMQDTSSPTTSTPPQVTIVSAQPQVVQNAGSQPINAQAVAVSQKSEERH